jgi:hypothetical protein
LNVGEKYLLSEQIVVRGHVSSPFAKEPPPMLNHLVLMKFKSDVSNSDIETLEKKLDDLPNIIPQIHMYEFGRDVIGSERSYDFGIVSLFANSESLRLYQKHPEHQKVLELIGSICESVVTVDFEGTDAASLKSTGPYDMLLQDDDSKS